jgi:hypothetical protein
VIKYDDEWNAVTGEYKAAVREANAEQAAAEPPRPGARFEPGHENARPCALLYPAYLLPYLCVRTGSNRKPAAAPA